MTPAVDPGGRPTARRLRPGASNGLGHGLLTRVEVDRFLAIAIGTIAFGPIAFGAIVVGQRARQRHDEAGTRAVVDLDRASVRHHDLSRDCEAESAATIVTSTRVV